METIRDTGTTILIGGVTLLLGWSVYSCYKKTGTISIKGLATCFLTDTGEVLGKVGLNLAKDAWKHGIKPGAKKLYSKALKPLYKKGLKPAGKAIFNKGLKPSYKFLKNAPKKLEHSALNPKALRWINPISHNSIQRRIMTPIYKKGGRAVKKGFKKMFRIK